MKLTRKQMAALAAVYAYIRSEEESAALGAEVPIAEPIAQPTAQKHWGLSGRLDIMQWRGLMQMRTFRSHGVR